MTGERRVSSKGEFQKIRCSSLFRLSKERGSRNVVLLNRLKGGVC